MQEELPAPWPRGAGTVLLRAKLGWVQPQALVPRRELQHQLDPGNGAASAQRAPCVMWTAMCCKSRMGFDMPS